MKLLSIICIVFAVYLGHQKAFAVEPENTAVESVISDLRSSANLESARQVINAINSSETLRQELGELVAENRFSRFLISPRVQIEDGRAGFFGAFTQGQKIVLATEYLKELKNTRLFDVAYPDDILPDNTVFVLAHLFYHLRYPLEPQKYSSPEEFSAAALKIEATAFIQAWNATLKTAEQKNEGRPLSGRQVGQLLMNARYRFALIGAMTQKVGPLKFLPSGLVETNDMNIQAVVATLRNARHADLE